MEGSEKLKKNGGVLIWGFKKNEQIKTPTG
jgi:hypothetical protein